MLLRKFVVVPLAVITLTSLQALAQEDNFEASIAFGYVGTSGNTNTDTFNLEYLMSLTTDMWLHNVKFQALASQENSKTEAERYYLEDKSDYNLNEEHYLFVKGSYADDRFSGFEYQAAVSTGYGHYLIAGDRFELQGFGGVGYRSNDVTDAGKEGEAIITLGQKLSWTISDNASLTQSLTTEIGNERAVSLLDLGIEANIIGNIHTKIAFQLRNNSDVPVDRKKIDTLMSVNLVYSF